MPKYKKVNEGIIDNFLGKLFQKVGEKATSQAIDKLADQDPQFKSDYETLQSLQKKMKKRLNTKAKRDAALKKALARY
tara:strand:+ start:100 stop:333 length:234 start_codon:yes stop_codon:yes gene_type:complete